MESQLFEIIKRNICLACCI